MSIGHFKLPSGQFGFNSVKLFLFIFLLFPLSCRAAADQYSNDSLLGYWKFDDGSTSVATDSGAPEGNPGNLSGTLANTGVSTSCAPLVFGNPRCLRINGTTNSYASIPNTYAYSALTFSLWVKLDAIPSASAIIAGNYNSNFTRGFFFRLGPGNVSFNVGNGAVFSLTSNTNIAASQWTLLTGTWSSLAQQLKLYVNGSFQGSQTVASVSSINTSDPLHIGNVSGNPCSFSGYADDVRLYSRVLSDTEIHDLSQGKHISSAWNAGGSDVEFERASNWNTGFIPDPYTLVSINAYPGHQPQFTMNEEMAGLTINPGADLNIYGFNLKFNDNGTFTNNGTLFLDNTNTLTGFSNDTDSGTIEIRNSSAQSSLKTGDQYYDLTINSVSSLTTSAALKINNDLNVLSGDFTLGSDATVSKNLNLEGGTLDASNRTISLAGNWNRTGGVFTPGSSTVIFNGGDQTIYGDNTFNNLTKSPLLTSPNPFDRFGFEAQKTQTINNILNIQGTTAHLINLRSTNPSTGTSGDAIAANQWKIDPQGTSSSQRVIMNLDVKDSNNVSGTDINVTGRNIYSSGNNSHWAFETSPPAISLDPVSSPTNNTRPAITGKAAKTMTAVQLVEYKMSSDAGWTACSFTSGNVNNMGFSCVPASALADGIQTMYLRATDADGNVTGPDDYVLASFSVDTAKPIISAVDSSHGKTSADITWKTDEGSSSKVQYGKSDNYGNNTSEEDLSDPVTDHTVTLSDLAECTTYHFRIKSKDAAGNEAIGSDQSFTTNDDLGAPDLKEAEAIDTTSILLKFDPAEGTIDHYELEYGKTSGSFDRKETGLGDKDSVKFTVKSLTPGTTYYFRLRAVNSCGKAEWSKAVSETTKNEAASKTPETSSEGSPLVVPGNSNPNAVSNPTAQEGSISPQTDLNSYSSSDWQLKYFGSVFCYDAATCGPEADPDGDGIINSDEFRLGTDPKNKDTDHDGTTDSAEIEKGKDPAKAENDPGGDSIDFESPKEKGEVDKDEYKVQAVETVETKEGGKRLKISGQGPPNTYVTVYVYSDVPKIMTVKTDSNGNWSYVLSDPLEDGEHQVYVAITDNTGKISVKSEPLAFIKTAESVTVIPPAEASSAGISPTKKRAYSDLVIYTALGTLAFVISIAGIGLVVKNNRKDS